MKPNLPLAASDSSIHDPRHRKQIMFAICIALMAVIASVSGLNVAQPQIALALNASQSDVFLMINIYAITMAALLLPLGAVGDRWGRKPVLIIGLVIFGIANGAAGLAPSTEIMLLARFLSGVGAAMIMPVTLAVITSSFPKEERSKAIGIWTAVAGGGGLIGMFLSAILVDLASWRALFILPIGLVVVAFFITLRAVPNSREQSIHSFDTVGSLLSMLVVIGLIFFLHEGPAQGWTAPITLLSLLVGGVSTIAFVLWERYKAAPLLDVRLFRRRGLAVGSLALLTVFGVQAGVFISLYPYFQMVLGWSGLRSTLAFMPMAIMMMFASGLAPQLAQRIGSHLTMALGIVMGALGLAFMAGFVSIEGAYLSVLPGMLAMGIGMGLSMTPSTEAITAALPREQQGIASALNDVTREFGTALGVALLGAVLTAGYRTATEAQLQGLPSSIADSARSGLANALAAADQSQASSQLIVQAAQQAFVSGWQQSMWAGVVVMALLLGYVLLQGPSPSHVSSPEAEESAAMSQ